MRQKYRLIETDISPIPYSSVIKRIENNLKNRNKSLLICPIASQTIVLATRDYSLRSALSEFDLIVPCSQWVRYSLKFLYGKKTQDRTYGPNLMLKTCYLASKKGYRVFLCGTTKQTLEKLEINLKKLFPKINIVGTSPSVFRQLKTREKEDLIKKIGLKKTDILLIGLGSPLQEIFTYDLLKRKPLLKKPVVIMTVGASFDFIAKIKPQAPNWMQDSGLEWFFRLLNEPTRLWKRYLLLGPLFIVLVLKQKIKLLLNLTDNIIVKNKIRSSNT